MQVVVDNLLTQYDLRGKKGPVVLLLHGWGDTLQTYDALAQQLTKYAQVVRLDLPGFGQTQAPPVVWGLQDYARFVARFLDKLSLSAAVVVGHSNGGAVLIKALASGEVSAERLVLLASAGVRDRQNFRKKLFKVAAKVGKALTWWLPRSTRQKLQRKFYGTIGSDYLVAPHLQETFKRTVAEDIVADARTITLPTLLIYGERDTATPLDSVGMPLHQAIARSRLKVVHGANHFVHQQATVQVADLIKEFMRK